MAASHRRTVLQPHGVYESAGTGTKGFLAESAVKELPLLDQHLITTHRAGIRMPPGAAKLQEAPQGPKSACALTAALSGVRVKGKGGSEGLSLTFVSPVVISSGSSSGSASHADFFFTLTFGRNMFRICFPVLRI